MPKQMQFEKTGLYMRLSRDDEKSGESMSIENQRTILHKFVEQYGGNIVDEYIDDGWSGTDFNRPGVMRLLDDAKTGKIDTIIVKDLSRFGRNYIQVGQYIDYIFPAYGIRFIALSDNVDTADRSSTAMDMMPIMNVFNEWHAANTSKKIRAVQAANQRAGKYTNWEYPFGYKAGADAYRTALIDEQAAKIVRRIYEMRAQGASTRTIVRTLTDVGIPNPSAYYTRKDGQKWNRNCSDKWSTRTVMWILTNPVYIGRLIQHKTTRISYKNHKIVNVPENEWVVKENAHEPIISQELWDKVQTVNNSVSRGKADKANTVHIMSGLLVCADCGAKMKIKYSHRKGERAYYFVCRTYVDFGKKYCTSHNISEQKIESLVLQDIQAMLTEVIIDEEKAKERFIRNKAKSNEQNRYSDEQKLKALKNRLAELDEFIQYAFEEKVRSQLPENVCSKLCANYQAEISDIERTIEETEKRLAEYANNKGDAEEYIRRLKQYGSLEELTRETVLQLIDFITVGEKKDDLIERNINIYYKIKSNVSIEELRRK
ncbi:MAG: recombinase family protein [Candidatus Coproplasma sp.]